MRIDILRIALCATVLVACSSNGGQPADTGQDASTTTDTAADTVRDTSREPDASQPTCPPSEPPAAYGRSCGGDGECGEYLRCLEETCDWPPAMSGVETGATTTLEFRGDDAQLTLPAELAAGDVARRRGLANRPCMQPGWAMLFVNPDEEELRFTAEEMRFAMDLIFADAQGQVVQVYTDVQPGFDEPLSSQAPAKYAVELQAGELAGQGMGEVRRIVVDDAL